MTNEKKDELALDCLLLAGQIMMESGAETYRVEDTMLRMARSQNLDAQSYVTPTGIILSLGEKQKTKIISISSRITDLYKIAKVNEVSRKLTLKIITLDEAYDELRFIQKTNYFLPIWLQIFMSAVSSACFLILFRGNWTDMPAAFLAGGAGYLALLLMQHLTKVKFFSEFFASFVVALVAFLAVTSGYGNELDKIIISGVMPLVPGILITNAVRDLMAGHLTAGIAKGTEAFLTAFAIGSGVAIVVAIH
ncbi:threonine/serine exporter family protein [Ureibacillus sp. FSL K6-8385]|uniref:Threonine/serine exporter family protein n=1 Tax=Ureibacillus terrenus TaxID=118246 RepID=A0A540V5B6_9BACL|nr:threonine/serine exporter family protein [Ureibacillus terrenus]MED3661138.1 threonine/serine exporter family protein [Ureibacillus terrenus]MED3764384.1 threonine/serine exporter family protein [Ureibacillus terrenus]TQE91941.1 threonine/serine exporter family protein [Ureibacillus terrenus]